MNVTLEDIRANLMRRIIPMPTAKMTRFMKKNKAVAIARGTRLTKDNRQVFTKADMYESDRARYWFADDEDMTITDKDRASAPAFNPRWIHEEHDK